MITSNSVIDAFDAAAAGYDQAAQLQQQVAAFLVAWAAESGIAPHTVLDIGSGTGLVAEHIHSRWPQASITCFDASPSMLAEAKRKMPYARLRQGNAAQMEKTELYEAAFSSMLLHWLPDPQAVLRHWQKHLQPHGRLFVAVPVEGSFAEWRRLCRRNTMEDGLRSFPGKDFAQGLTMRGVERDFSIAYPSAAAFLRSMKKTGAATARPEHRPASAARLRQLLNDATRPFSATCRMMFLELPARSDP